MDLKSLIRPQLWNEISNSYLAENYRTAILDAMRFLSKVIREKSGLDGDGAPLAGQALGGEDPKLRLNRLQTQSEKDEQKGFLQLIIGLYTAIRNPRTHDESDDDKNTADPIIYFINHVLALIDVAKPPFTVENFILHLLDPDFVESQDYAKELVKEIPRNKYLETIIEIYRRKHQISDRVLELTFGELTRELKEGEIKDLMSVVSDELQTVSDDGIIITIIRILPAKFWPYIKLSARMRIENKLIKSIEDGRQALNSDKVMSGVLGTWASQIIDHFTLKQELESTIKAIIFDTDQERIKYVVNFFMKYFPSIFTRDYVYRFSLVRIKELVIAGDDDTAVSLESLVKNCPAKWIPILKKEFSEWTDPDNPEIWLPDGSPFLGKVPRQPSGGLPF